ncbi:MAG: permease-like cell division protein FtsX [Candidatus Eremiobacteraeota bacterium]|nr:permease-like cell division protein FtsX [Candidatus Eremiobacteraeota bacterium]
MQVTAIGTVTVTIVILGAFLYVRASLTNVGADALSQIKISAYLATNVSEAQKQSVLTALAKDNRVADVAYVPKRDGLRELRMRMKGQIDTSILTENPLPDKLRVRVRSPEQVANVARSLQKMPGIQFVDYGQSVVGKMLALFAVVRRVSIAVIALFIAVAGIIIANTIRLTVFARRREISIMQLVGATNMYIRLPFICEGLLDGLIGALLAVAILAAGRAALIPKLIAALPFLQLGAIKVDVLSLAPDLLAVGCAVGLIASWISVGRYLRT